jgi:hypothetical protein
MSETVLATVARRLVAEGRLSGVGEVGVVAGMPSGPGNATSGARAGVVAEMNNGLGEARGGVVERPPFGSVQGG